MDGLIIFSAGDGQSFDDFCHEGAFTFWYARDLMKMMGYQSYDSFYRVINKAIGACTSLAIAVTENFIQDERLIDGKKVLDYQLSRFACYLIAMNADSSKREVAAAQAFFARVAEAFSQFVREAESVERVSIRDEVTDGEKILNSTASQAGVVNYGLFQNAGYRGLYNMNISQLKARKGIASGRSPLDFMGREELAANLFRITQTESKIRQDEIRGQKPAEEAAESVGRKVRGLMQEISGVAPENLPISEDIRQVRSRLKGSHKEFKKMDRAPKG